MSFAAPDEATAAALESPNYVPTHSGRHQQPVTRGCWEPSGAPITEPPLLNYRRQQTTEGSPQAALWGRGRSSPRYPATPLGALN